MTLTALSRTTALAAIIAAGVTTGAAAQTATPDPHHPGALAQATPPAQPGGTGAQGQGAQPGQSGTMPSGMMGRGMMGQGMMGQGMMQPGMMGAMPMMRMRGHMMKIMFAIADANGDGGLSFEEISAIHKRIFDRVDANKDGKVTPDETRDFMRE